VSVALFAYGSLMDPASAARMLGRPVAPGELVPAVLRGHARTWTLRERVVSQALGREVTAVFLDLSPAPGSRVNGVVMRVSDAELAAARVREKNYDAVDITPLLEPAPAGGVGRAWTFVARPEFLAREEDGEMFVMERYEQMVRAAAAPFGPRFREQYAATTVRTALPRLPGGYTFVDPEQAKLV
jgi:cation transport regulator ChaC